MEMALVRRFDMKSYISLLTYLSWSSTMQRERLDGSVQRADAYIASGISSLLTSRTEPTGCTKARKQGESK